MSDTQTQTTEPTPLDPTDPEQMTAQGAVALPDGSFRFGPPGSSDPDYDPEGPHHTEQTDHYALVKAGVVENVAAVDASTPNGKSWLNAVAADYDAVVDVEQVDTRPCPGWTYDGKAFTEPPEASTEPTPHEQALATIASLADSTDPNVAKLAQAVQTIIAPDQGATTP